MTWDEFLTPGYREGPRRIPMEDLLRQVAQAKGMPVLAAAPRQVPRALTFGEHLRKALDYIDSLPA